MPVGTTTAIPWLPPRPSKAAHQTAPTREWILASLTARWAEAVVRRAELVARRAEVVPRAEAVVPQAVVVSCPLRAILLSSSARLTASESWTRLWIPTELRGL